MKREMHSSPAAVGHRAPILILAALILTTTAIGALHGLAGNEPLPASSRIPEFESLLVVQRQALRPSHVYTYHNEDFRPGGGLYRWYKDGRTVQLVDAGQGQILDLQVSWDGKEVLFSWRRSEEETYHIYRMNVDGTGLTQLTQGAHYNFNPAWLPDGGIAFLSTRNDAYAYCWNSPVGVLYRMNRDGSELIRLSANYLNDFTPNVLHDGRIMYSRWEYVDRPAIPIQSLWTMRPDGTGLQVYYGNRVLSPATFMEARPIPGTEKVLTLLTAHNREARGGVGILDRRKGVNAQQAIRNITPEVDIGEVDKGDGNHIVGPYENPFPLDARWFLVSYDGHILLRDYEGTEEHILLPSGDDMGFFNPQPVRATPVPPIASSALQARETPHVSETGHPMATLYLQDIYEGLEPYVQRGEVAALRVVEEVAKPIQIHPSMRAFGFQFPVVSSGATYAPKRIWGETPVAADGSAAFEVPAGRPIYFMALDKQGRALQRMRSFTHLMPGEIQSCIGCHEDRQHRAMTPLNTATPEAFRRPPVALVPPEWGVEGFSYRRLIQPIWETHCVGCHNAHESSGGIDLSGDRTDFFNVSYEGLVRKGTPATDPMRSEAAQDAFNNPFTSWISTYNGSEANILEITPGSWGSPASRLADLILAGHPDADGVARTHLSAEEMRRVFAWIDVNVPYYGTSDTHYPEATGSRRLWPESFESVMNRVATQRCNSCHDPSEKRTWYLRVEKPELNSFMLAPLAASAGGTEACGEAVFESVKDPDYRALMQTFEPVRQLLEQRPRLDDFGATLDNTSMVFQP